MHEYKHALCQFHDSRRARKAVDESGDLMRSNDRRRMYSLGNRLWHTDASFQDPPGRYSILSARVVPPVRADTEYADMRAAFDGLDAEMKTRIASLRAHHSIAYSRITLGFEFSPDEQEKLKGAVHPLVRTNPRTGRKSLYLASHASRVEDWPVPEGRLLLRDLIEHATQPAYVYRHAWHVGDLVIWDRVFGTYKTDVPAPLGYGCADLEGRPACMRAVQHHIGHEHGQRRSRGSW
jgi:alpha-ketoglutarate-dependent 2,4-dichlorophenoxyacetate dioxygenase